MAVDLLAWQLLRLLQREGPLSALLKSFQQSDKGPAATHDRQRHLKSLRRGHEGSGLVLVLGAGVSTEFALPQWTRLLQELYIEDARTRVPAGDDAKDDAQLTKRVAEIYYATMTPSPLIAARHLKLDAEDRDFKQRVRTVLYRHENFEVDATTFHAVAQLCTVRHGDHAHLNSIITYNFDDLLERFLDAHYKNLHHQSLWRAEQTVDRKRFPIFHVHGFLPREGELDDSPIIFGEAQYHEQYQNPYSWNNLVQLSKLRDNMCLFVGVSLTDPNLRRLLEVSARLRGAAPAGGEPRYRHYVVRRREPLDDIARLIRSRLPVEGETAAPIEDIARMLKAMHERFVTVDDRSFGVGTVWIDNFAELPDLLHEIRGA